MHRSGSTSRVSDEFYAANNGLPTYDPQSEVSKKEALKVRFAENMVHLIPVVLIFCAVLLWFFSHPEIDVMSKDDVLARVKNMTIEGYSNSNWNITSTNTVNTEDLDPIDGIGMVDPGKELDSKKP